MRQRLVAWVLAFVMALSVVGMVPQAAEAGAWHCSLSTYVWSSASRVYTQAAVYCPQGHSGVLVAGNTITNRASSADVWVPAGGWAYHTMAEGCTPGTTRITDPYSLFYSGGQRIENWRGGTYVYCTRY